MSQKLGSIAGGFVLGSTHLGWAETCITAYGKIVSEQVLNAVLNSAALNANYDNNIFPIARLYFEHEATKERTLIQGMTRFTVRVNKRSPKGSFDLSVDDAVASNPRVASFFDMMTPKNTYYLIIESGYRVDGVDYWIPVMKGVKESCIEYYGRNSSAINVVGWDLTDNLERVEGYVSSYTGGAKSLISQLLNDAGFQSYDLRFDDFNFTSQDFSYDTALDLINGIIKKFGTLHYYIEGDGTFVLKEQSNSQSIDYDYSAQQNIFSLEYENNVAERVNVVRVNGQGIFVKRVDVADQADYGIRKREHQSNLIQNQADAEAAADAVMQDSFKEKVRFTIPFNPYITIDSVLRVNYGDAQISDMLVRVAGLTHYFMAEGKQFKTQVQGELVDIGAHSFQTTEVLP